MTWKPDSGPLWQKLAWFGLLWCAGLAAVLAAAWLIRLFLFGI